MIRDGKFVVAKAIPLNEDGSKSVREGTIISIMNDIIYQDGYLVANDWQSDYKNLILYEEKNGWNYLLPDNPKKAESLI